MSSEILRLPKSDTEIQAYDETSPGTKCFKKYLPKKKQAEKTVKLYLHFTMSSTFLGCLKERVEPL